MKVAKQMKKKLLASLLLTTTSLAVQAGDFEQQISLYGWLPSLNGSLTFEVPNEPGEPGEPDDSVDANAIDSLDTVFMGTYSIRKNKWSFTADLIHLKMSGDSQGIINPDSTLSTEITARLYGAYAGYNILNSKQNDLNLIAGIRHFGLDFEVKLSGENIKNGKIEVSTSNNDVIIGLDGKYIINENWYMPYYVDIGTGDSDLTWQASTSIAYKYNWGDVIATYRYMHYGQSDSLLVEDFNLYGFKLGVIFNF